MRLVLGPLLLALLAAVASGCVYSRAVSLDSARDRAAVNARAARGHAVVAVDGQRGRQVRDLRVGPDTTTWTDKKTGEARSAPTAHVSGITFRRDGAGALKGLAVGVGVGAALGLAASTAPQDGFFTLPPQTWALLGAIDGAVLGVLAGAIHSERHVYRPAAPPAAAGPPGPCAGPPLACAAPQAPTPPRRP